MPEHKNTTLDDRNDLAIRDAAERAFCKRHGYIAPRGYSWSCACAHLLRREKCPKDSRDCTPTHPRVWDHISVYTRIADGRNVIVCQPYCQYHDYDNVADLVKKFSAKWGLNYRISNEESFHFPGKTLLIELSPPPAQEDSKMEVRG
jgi:hypothetical protein